MKTTKRFFDSHNRLNKGYKADSNLNKRDKDLLKKKFLHILPPAEVLAEYEDIHPGSFEKIIKLAEKEQEHKHESDLALLRLDELRLKFAKNVTYTSAIILSCLAVILTILADNMLAFVATIIAILFIAWSSLKSSRKLLDTQSPKQKYVNNFKHKKFTSKSGYKYK